MKHPILLIALALVVPIAAFAESKNDTVCQALAPRSTTLTNDRDRTIMTAACERAAVEHEQRAGGLTGADRQQEQLHEAASLYFASFGEIAEGRTRQGVNSLAKSRRILLIVRDHGATSELRDKARAAAAAVDQAINRLGNM